MKISNTRKLSTARRRFTVGDSVRATPLAFRNGVFWPEDAPVFGTVCGFMRAPLGILVQRHNRKTKVGYHIDFWRKVAP